MNTPAPNPTTETPPREPRRVRTGNGTRQSGRWSFAFDGWAQVKAPATEEDFVLC